MLADEMSRIGYVSGFLHHHVQRGSIQRGLSKRVAAYNQHTSSSSPIACSLSVSTKPLLEVALCILSFFMIRSAIMSVGTMEKRSSQWVGGISARTCRAYHVCGSVLCEGSALMPSRCHDSSIFVGSVMLNVPFV